MSALTNNVRHDVFGAVKSMAESNTMPLWEVAMSTLRGMLDEIRDVTPGLWLWRVRHPGWRPGLEWQPVVTSTCVESDELAW